MRTVYGMSLDAAFEIPAAPLGLSKGAVRSVHIQETTAAEIAGAFRVGEGDWYFDDADEHGRRFIRLEHHPDLGFRIWAARYGSHLISNDGRAIRSALPFGPAWRWQRLFFAQVLPLAAMLQGLELFHASGVGIDGRAAIFVATPGTGKSSIACQLIARGADFLADDVVPLVPGDGVVTAHPGPALACIHRNEYAKVPKNERARLGRVLGRSDKLILSPPAHGKPLPLRVLYLLRRSEGVAETRIVRLHAPDPRRLLSSMFLSYLRAPSRLTTLLDVSAAVARDAIVCDVELPQAGSAREAAVAIERHFRELAA